MAKNHVIEKLFFHEGFKCVVVLNAIGHRCGYVGVEPDHPFYGIGYSDKIKDLTLNRCAMTSPLGKRSIIDAMCWRGEDDEISPGILCNVHGGLTYSGGTKTFPTNQFDPLYWFGFDCAHLNDGKDWESVKEIFPTRVWKPVYDLDMQYRFNYSSGIIRSKDYVEQECRNLADSLGSVYLIGDHNG